MKKIVSLALILFLSLGAFAQESKGFQLGLQLSPNLSWFKPGSDRLKSDGMKFGFSYGITGDFNIADNYAIATGITLMNSGGKINYPDRWENVAAGGRTSADIRLKYIQIPLAIKLKTNQIGYMKYFGQFGFAAAFNYDAKSDKNFNYPKSSNSISKDNVDISSEINFFRASLVIGLGAEYNISGNTSIVFGISFDNGFMNVLSKDNYDKDEYGNAIGKTKKDRNKDFNAINNSLIFNFGVLF